MIPKFKKLAFSHQLSDGDFLNYLNYLKEWLVYSLKVSQKDGFIFGLSGGIDSSLLAVIISSIMQKENYLSLTMTMSDCQDDHKFSELLVKHFQLKNICLNLTTVLESQLKCINPILCKIPQNQRQCLIGNIKSRLRALNLYAFAQHYNYLVVGTINYDEWITGYFTKYGDGACDLAPFRYLIKSDITRLAKLMHVPEQIVSRLPTASFYKGQTDENELEFSYEQLDNVLTGNCKPNKKMTSLFTNSSHKRELPISPKMFRDLIKKLK